MKKGRLKSIIFGGLFSLFIPLGAYLFLKSKGHDGHITLPKQYGIASIDSNIVDGKLQLDTTYHTVADLLVYSQLGDTLALHETYKGKILVYNFFFTSCQTICPPLTKNMKLLNKAFLKNDTSIRFISLSVDPLHDSVPVLRRYANQYEANHDKWIFATASKKSIYDFARYQLLLDLPQGNGDEQDFIHPEQFVLVDKYRNIRGYYNGLDSNDVRRCAEDIAYLLVEKNKIHEKKKR